MGVILKSIQQKSFLIATTKHQKKTILGQQVRGKNLLSFFQKKKSNKNSINWFMMSSHDKFTYMNY